MRMWHKDLISVLPQKQLVAQWRELCCIARNIANDGTPNHLLVNKVMKYPLQHFTFYTDMIIKEMRERGYNVSQDSYEKFVKNCNDAALYFVSITDNQTMTRERLYYAWHDDRYLVQCYNNLEEKFDCGGLTIEEYANIVNMVSNKLQIRW